MARAPSALGWRHMWPMGVKPLSSLDERPFPAAALVGAGMLVLSTVAGVGAIQLNKHFYHITNVVELDSGSPIVRRELRFDDQGDGVNAYAGHVRVFDATTGIELPPLRNSDGFVRAVLNSLNFERTKRDLNGLPVFELVRWSDNRITLQDRITGKFVDVGEFGPGNKAVFVRFLPSAKT
jgi:putative photosynthetic complex assembly protein